MAGPVAVVRDTLNQDGTLHSRSVQTWCPGCDSMHPFRIEDRTERRVTWQWDGNLEAPTFSPSLLVHQSVHLCGGPHLVPCPGGDCGHIGHAVLDDGTLAVTGSHTVEPAYGDCHSFLVAGRWQFLGDSAHRLAGQTVDMVPLPDWLL